MKTSEHFNVERQIVNKHGTHPWKWYRKYYYQEDAFSRMEKDLANDDNHFYNYRVVQVVELSEVITKH